MKSWTILKNSPLVSNAKLKEMGKGMATNDFYGPLPPVLLRDVSFCIYLLVLETSIRQQQGYFQIHPY
jgi:hypothetical protein